MAVLGVPSGARPSSRRWGRPEVPHSGPRGVHRRAKPDAAGAFHNATEVGFFHAVPNWHWSKVTMQAVRSKGRSEGIRHKAELWGFSNVLRIPRLTT